MFRRHDKIYIYIYIWRGLGVPYVVKLVVRLIFDWSEI